MNEDKQVKSLVGFMQSRELIQALVESRRLYKDIKEVAEDKNAPAEQRYEAKELTKDGFYSFIGKASKMTTGGN